MNRLSVTKSILWFITGLAVTFGAARMFFGLGAVSNLSDATPWGIWKGINVVPGIALAAGGFVVTAIIYVMRHHEYHRYAKVSVLLAFLGYITAATALVVELGLPWMVWHPIVYWQHHSALFEISWCVILYLTVLFLEFIPTPMEETSRFAGIRRFLIKYKIVLVFLGIMISTLHQSSLGTLFLITPEKLHPLWYSSLLPVLFFISAIAIGPLMLIVGVLTISTLYNKPLEMDKLSKLAVISMIVLIVYALIRWIDLAATAKLAIAFTGSWQTLVFWAENSLLLFIPIILLAIPSVRRTRTGLWTATGSAVIGMVLNRANMAGIMFVATGKAYTPTMYEIVISLGILSAAILAFLFCIERFNIWDVKWSSDEERPEASPRFGHASDVWLGTPRIAGRMVYSLVFVFSLAVGLAILPVNRIQSAGVSDVPAAKARGGATLFIDGNRDGYGVVFAHDDHAKRLGGDSACVQCHHSNVPMDKQSGCHECHRNMYVNADVFRHDWHAAPAGGNLTCNACHQADRQRTAETAVACDHCHKDMVPTGATITLEQYLAPSYANALHGMCIACHQEQARVLAEKPDLGRCASCHTLDDVPMYLPDDVITAYRDTMYNHVVLPQSNSQTDGN
ncbi:MAG: polysulfide reductase NrfD [candidate division Zixibacteria bacterium]|nr:polysulfide reductase NrfD [candidate division Zixibacteria bacterium]